MTAVADTTIAKVSSAGAKQELATLLSDVIVSRNPTRQPRGLKHWRFVVRTTRATSQSKRNPDRSVSDLDYAAWHAHLAGTRRWTTGRHRGLGS